jgi:hypothetical protein
MTFIDIKWKEIEKKSGVYCKDANLESKANNYNINKAQYPKINCNNNKRESVSSICDTKFIRLCFLVNHTRSQRRVQYIAKKKANERQAMQQSLLQFLSFC